jgi:hypothetical protein
LEYGIDEREVVGTMPDPNIENDGSSVNLCWLHQRSKQRASVTYPGAL